MAVCQGKKVAKADHIQGNPGLKIIMYPVGGDFLHHLLLPGVGNGQGQILVHGMQNHQAQVVGLCLDAKQKLSRSQGVAEPFVRVVEYGGKFHSSLPEYVDNGILSRG